VGGSPSSAKPVVIPNFAFGGGRRGTMVANDSEYIVPNYANGGDAIFNQNMASSMGLPANARKVRAAGGYIPNFVNENEDLVLFTGDRGGDKKSIFHVGKKNNKTHAYANKNTVPKGMRTSQVAVPIYNMKPGQGDAQPQDIQVIRDQLSTSATDTALKFAKDLSGKTQLPNITVTQIKKLFNPGAFEGMSGSVFEVAIASILSSREFLDYSSRTDTSRIDLPYSSRLFSKFGAEGKGKMGAEVKANSGLAAGAAIKFYDVLHGGEQVASYKKDTLLGKQMTKTEFEKKYPAGINGVGYLGLSRQLGTVSRGSARLAENRGASGYIPNFAEGALGEAINREKDAGLPVSQIRINQSGKLRNSQNPMGLAVTNTRDEPTGAIPNFARNGVPSMGGMMTQTFQPTPAATGTPASDPVGRATDNFSSKLLGLSTAMFLVQSGMSSAGEEATGLSKVFTTLIGAVSKVVMVASLIQAFGGASAIKSFASGAAGTKAMAAGKATMASGGGLKYAVGAIQKVGGSLLRFAGPVAAAATVTYGVVKAFGWASDNLSGTADSIKRSGKILEQSALNTAKALDELQVPEDVKDKFNKANTSRSAFMVDQAINNHVLKNPDGTDRVFKNLDGTDNKDINMKGVKLDLAGYSDNEQIINMKLAANAFLDNGGTLTDLKTMLETLTSDKTGPRGSIGQTAIDNFNKVATRKPDKSVQQKYEELKASIPPELVKSYSESRKNSLEEGKKTKEQRAANQKPFFEFSTLTKKSGLSFKLALQAMEDRIADMNAAEGEDTVKIARIKMDTAKAELQTQINIIKIKSEALTGDEKSLSIAKITKSLSDSQILGRQKNIDLAKLDIQQGLSMLAIIEENAKAMEGLNVDPDKFKDLTRILSGLNIGDLQDPKKFEDLAKKTLGLADNLSESEELALDSVRQKVIGLKEENKARKDNVSSTAYQRQYELKINEAISRRISLLKSAVRESEINDNFEMSQRRIELDLKRDLALNNPTLTDTSRARMDLAFTQKAGALAIEEKEKQTVSETKKELIELIDVLGEKFSPQINAIIDQLEREGAGGLSKARASLVDVLDQDSNNQAYDYFKSQTPQELFSYDPPLVTAMETTPDTRALPALDTTKIDKIKDAAYNIKERENDTTIAKQEASAANEMADARLAVSGFFKDFNLILRDFIMNLRADAEQLRFASLSSQDSSSMVSNLDERILNARISKNPTSAGISSANTQAGLEGMDRQILMAGSRGESDQLRKEKDILIEQLSLKDEAAAITVTDSNELAKLLAIREKLLNLDKKKSELEKNRTYKERLISKINDPLTSSSILRENLAEASMNFAHNIGDAMLQAIASGDKLGDILLGVGVDFLNTISKAFMNKAVNDMMEAFIPTAPKAPAAPAAARASGGPISGGSGHKDDVPAMLMGGEFVMNKKSVKKYGMGFMSALNNGSLQGFASGGQVRDEEGMFTTPGMNGAGAISGGANLLSFATQTPVALNRDTITSSGAFLDAESGRMTMFGKRNNSEFQKVQDAKQQAFDLYASEMNARQQAKEQEKANKKALMDSLKGALISAAVSAGVSSMVSGYKAGSESAGGSWWNKFKGGLAGTVSGGKGIDGKSYGGLTNLFSERGYMSGPPKADGSPISSGSTSKGGGLWSSISKGLSNIFSSTADPNQTYNTAAPASNSNGTYIPFDSNGNYVDAWADFNQPQLKAVGAERKATGGLIPPAGGVDTVPAMLSGGEFVMNAAATRNIGADNLQALNSGSGSSDNAELVSKLDELIIATGASKSMGDINITINGSAGTESKEEGKDSSDRQRDLSEKIKTVVKQVIADEQRLGGQLRK
jgi:hypothetical protein